MPVNFYPTKGMAQRGGFVKAQLRAGPRAGRAERSRRRGADLVIATEVSEALKAVRYVKPDGDFVLFGARLGADRGDAGQGAVSRRWTQVLRERASAGSRGRESHHIAPESLPVFEGAPVPDNIFTLAVALEPDAPGRDPAASRGRRGGGARLAGSAAWSATCSRFGRG